MNSPRLSARARIGHRALVSTQRRPRLACRAAAAEPPMLTLPGLQHLPVAGYLLELRKAREYRAGGHHRRAAISSPEGATGDWLQDPAGFYLRVQEECMKQGLEAARTDLGPISLTYLYSQRHVQHVLQDSRGLYTKSDVDRRALGLLIGNGLLLNEGEPHRQRRRIMMPCFTAERLDGFVRDMVAVANESVRRLQALQQQQQQQQQQEGQQGQGHGTSWQVQQASGDGVGAAVVVDIHAEALRCALSIIGRCGFSSDIGDSASEIGKALEECLSFAANNARSILPLPAWVPTPANLRYKHAREVLDRIVFSIITARRQQLASTPAALDLLALDPSHGVHTASPTHAGSSITPGMGGQEAAAASGCPMRTLTLAATPPAPTAAAAPLAETAGAPASLQPLRSGSAAAGSEASPHQHLDLAGCPARHVEVPQPGAAAQPAMAQHSGAGQQAAAPQPMATGQQAGGAKQADGTAPLRQAGQPQRDLLDMLLLARNEDGSALGDSELRDEVRCTHAHMHAKLLLQPGAYGPICDGSLLSLLQPPYSNTPTQAELPTHLAPQHPTLVTLVTAADVMTMVTAGHETSANVLVRSGSAAAGSEASPHQHLDLAGCPARHVEVPQPGAAAQPAMAQHSGAGQQAAAPQPMATGQQAGGAKQAGGTAPLRQAGQPQRDLLDMLLLARNEDGSALGDSELRDEVMTMVTAGHETSANVLAWAMYQLALHPEAVHQAVAEVQAVCGPGPEAVQPHHLPKLRYLEAVLQETLRLHPPVWAFDRQAAQQDELPGGVQIVQGSYILLSPYALHRQPDLFPEPDAFKPERFLEGGSAAALPRFQYIPFGGGGRSCIGSTFAMYEMKVLLATWLKAFPRLRLHPSALPVEAEASVTYRPRRPLTLALFPNTDRL
ncbi:hypothetical protein QJQ45_023003 [Haematococcus lacustris]|nr:hypothetical protein QJQ45_023003 [Haematococcus lacustris]